MLCAALIGLPAAFADDPVVFRSDVSLVRVDAQVVDGDHRVISGLGPRDFVLREQGRSLPVQSVDAENLPIDLLLLLDVSASMRPHVQRIAVASREALRQLREQDRVAILVFDRATRTRMAFRGSQSGVDRELERVLDYESFHGGTDITRGLLDAADYIRSNARREARKAIVIVTDDQTEMNRDVEGVESALARADAVLMALIAPDAMRYGGMRRDRDNYPGGGYPGGGYPNGGGGPLGGIIFGSPRRRGGYPGGGQMGSRTKSAGTEEIARESGGDTMPVTSAYALQDTIARIRQSYAVYFAPPPGVRAGEERQIDLQLADAALRRYPGGEVYYRRSYYAQVSTAPGGAPNSDPVVVSRGDSSQDPDRPRLQRRPGVSPGGTREGPLDVGGGTAPSAAPAAQAAPPQAAPAQPRDPNAPGWRKARPDELPPN